MNWVSLAQILGGLALLVLGGELLVRGASALARRVGISPLVVGLTVVSAATSAPELAVSVGAVLDGQTDLAIGNIVGSNTANVLLIVGVAALIVPLVVTRQGRRIDVPALVLFSIAALVMSLDGRISSLDGVLLIMALISYTALIVLKSRRDTAGASERAADDDAEVLQNPWLSAGLVLGGVLALVVGSKLLVSGATAVALAFGISGLVVGLTVVAIGTSTPELASAIAAVRRGEVDIAIGNAVGSCLFNIGMVLGLPALLVPGGLAVPTAAIALDLPLMLAAAVTLVPMVFTGYQIARWEGSLLTLLYASYVTYMVLDAAGHDAQEGFSAVMLIFVLPTIAIALLGLVVYELGVRAGRSQVEAEVNSYSP